MLSLQFQRMLEKALTFACIGGNACVLQFVLTATGSDADKVIDCQRRKWPGAGLGRLPIFCVADYLS